MEVIPIRKDVKTLDISGAKGRNILNVKLNILKQIVRVRIM